MTERPTKTFIAFQIAGSVLAVTLAVLLAPDANWDIPSLLILLALGVASELECGPVGVG